jgi:hypothetical protein
MIVMRLVFALLAATLAFPLAGSTAAISAGRCLAPGDAFVSSFKPGVKAAYRSKLGKLGAVRSEGQFGPFPRSLQKGVFFVSARVRGVGTATWAVSADAYATGGGLIFGAEPVSRKVSIHGVDVPLSTLRGWGIAPYANGFTESRACVT